MAGVGTSTATLQATAIKSAATAVAALTGTGVSAHLYWATTMDGSINEANLGGSGPHAIIAGQDTPFGVAVDSSHLCWADAGSSTAATGTIWEASLDSSNPQVIITGQNGPRGVAVGPQ